MGIEHDCSRQTFVDAGKKGGSSPKRKERIKNRDKTILDEAREMLDYGFPRGDLVHYFYTRYVSDNLFPSTKRQFRNILQKLESD